MRFSCPLDAPEWPSSSAVTDDGRDWHSVFVEVDVPADREPLLREPDKCATWGWFAPTELPQPLFAPVSTILS